MSKLINKVSISVVSLATVLSLSGVASLVPAIAHGATAAELQAQITLLLAQISAMQAQLSTSGTTATSSAVPASLLSSSDLTVGSKGATVKALQMFLNANGYAVSASGAGSAGNETEYFGNATKAALAKLQAAQSVSPAAGYFGAKTRAKLATMSSATTGGTTTTTTGGTTTTTTATGTGLMVALAASQPAATIAPGGATRIPFTKVALTAGSSDVSVTSLLVERTGLGADAAIESVMLLDEAGQQLGLKKTLNSDHQATVGETFVVKAGQTRIVTVAANRAAKDTGTSGYSGQSLSFAVKAVNTSATVTGTLPITGTLQTVNESLTIGSATTARGTLDPGASVTKEVGSSAYTFAAVRVTAGSAERVYLKSVRWNQTGSASASDLANLKTVVEGTSYDATVSADGKYYTTIFADPGLIMEKGGSKEISVKGDISGGSLRTVNFDIAKRTDIYMVGETYGYGILTAYGAGTTTTANDSEVTTSDDPFYDGSLVTVSAGTVTASTWTGVPAANISINLADQILGGWSVDVKGEAVSVSSLKITITPNGDTLAHITQISLVDASGKKIAGPIDGTGTTVGAQGIITFTDTMTFPIGVTNLTLKGKLSTDFVSNDYVYASTTPSGWTITGQTTGNTITATPASALTSSQMTVKAASLNVSVSSQPTARNVIAGTTKYEFARYILDGTSSGEDVRVTSLPLSVGTTGTIGNATNCQLYNGTAAGATSLTTGSNVKNPTAVSSSTQMIFDGTGIIVSKGTTKTLSLRCDMAANAAASGIFFWGIDSAVDGANGSFAAATGLTSGQSLGTSATFTDATGQYMTVSAGGTYTVATDSSVLYTAYRAGTTATLGTLRFTASTDENLTLKQIALALGNSSASSSQADLVDEQVTLWNGNTQVGSAQFGGASPRNATSTLSTAVVISAGESVNITVKGSLTAQNAVQGTPGAFLQVLYDGDNNGLNGNYAMGATTVSGTSADQTLAGGRIFRNVPSFAVTSTSGGTFSANADLYTFRVTNPDASRDLVLKKLSFSIATSGTAAKFASFILYGAGVAANSAVDARDLTTADTALGQANTFDTVEIRFDATASTTEASKIAAASSKDYALRVTSYTAGTVTDAIDLALLADTSHPSCVSRMCTAFGIDALLTASSSNNIVWSPFSTTTPVVTPATENNLDWTNGYGLPGFTSNANFPLQSWSKKNN
ncbi:MAG: peptidoglycan-binding protein [bacterium]|nr:peptidoglycan-binding protein [bacterium]